MRLSLYCKASTAHVVASANSDSNGSLERITTLFSLVLVTSRRRGNLVRETLSDISA